MKRVILVLLIILLAVYIILSILGRNDENTAEKLFYQAMKANEKILINPDVAPPKLLAFVEKNLQKILQKYPNSNAVKLAQLALAEFYLNRKRYDEALSILNEVIDSEKQDKVLLSKVLFYKGIVYEKQDEWDKALKEYEILRDEFTDTLLGLQAPLYIGRYYIEKGKEAEADRAYNEAALFYEKLDRENRGKVLGYAASNLLRQTYMDIGKYEQAGQVVEDTISNYPSQLSYAQQLPFVELIFVNILKKPEKAIEIYKNVHEKINDEKLAKILQEKIKQLEGK